MLTKKANAVLAILHCIYGRLDVLDVVTSGSIWNTRIIVITIFSRTIARVIFQQHTTTRYFVLRSTHLPRYEREGMGDTESEMVTNGDYRSMKCTR